jgi:protein pelota
MDIISKDYKKGFAKLRVTQIDDLWYLSHIIDSGDLIKGKTTRKIKIGDNENAKVVRKTLTLKIEAESIDFGSQGSILRINGKIKESTSDIPKDSYHSISLEEGSEFTIQKINWPKYQIEKLKEASRKKYSFLIIAFDREEAIFALTKKFGFEILVQMQGNVAKKDRQVTQIKDFYQEIINTIEVYNQRYKPQSIILASPAFYKEDLLKKINNQELKKKIVPAIISSVTSKAIYEVFKRDELKELLKDTKAREEQVLIDQLLKEIKIDKLAAYGLKEVTKALNLGAISSILLTDDFISKSKEKNEFEKIDSMLKSVDTMQGKIHIISSQGDAGKQLGGLGGIAAILRYKI